MAYAVALAIQTLTLKVSCAHCGIVGEGGRLGIKRARCPCMYLHIQKRTFGPPQDYFAAKNTVTKFSKRYTPP